MEAPEKNLKIRDKLRHGKNWQNLMKVLKMARKSLLAAREALAVTQGDTKNAIRHTFLSLEVRQPLAIGWFTNYKDNGVMNENFELVGIKSICLCFIY